MYKKLKRIFDFTAALILVTVLSPLLMVLTVLIFLSMGRPVLFIQERPGLNCKIFKLYKLRSMKNGISTRLGKFLRITSMDEIPSLYNILKGDMSFVGPRPLLKEYLPYYNSNEIKRHDVLPGLTGLAQINGRNNLSWERRFELDNYYVSNVSFTLDLTILSLTIKKLFEFDGVLSQPGQNNIERLDVARSNK